MRLIFVLIYSFTLGSALVSSATASVLEIHAANDYSFADFTFDLSQGVPFVYPDGVQVTSIERPRYFVAAVSYRIGYGNQVVAGSDIAPSYTLDIHAGKSIDGAIIGYGTSYLGFMLLDSSVPFDPSLASSFHLDNLSGDSIFASFDANGGNSFVPTNVTVTFIENDGQPVFAAIPELPTWAMLIAGFGAMGILARRRHAPKRADHVSG